MVSRTSLKKFRENLEQYNREVDSKNFIRKSLGLAKDTFEIDISLATLPSLIVPEPDYVVKTIKRKLKNRK